jgi:hypothetical protein
MTRQMLGDAEWATLKDKLQDPSYGFLTGSKQRSALAAGD